MQAIQQSSVKLKGFDPYEILEINSSSQVSDIKKAYRKLSLKYHPDKNKDDPQATAKFILITKAYQCLTDEKAKSICEKYGNPDGPGSFNVGIALPSFLLRKENHVAVLCLFFVVLLIIIPGIVISWYQESSKYDNDGILKENKARYYFFLNENLIVKSIPEILGYSEEFQSLPLRSQKEGQVLTKHKQDIFSKITPPKNINNSKGFRPLFLICSYIFNLELPEESQADLAFILKLCPNMIKSIIDIAIQHQIPAQMFENRQERHFYKFMGQRCLFNLIEFGQIILQGVWQHESSLLQMQYFNNEDVMTSLNKKFKKLPTILELQQDKKKENIEKFLGKFSEEERKTIEEQLNSFPKIKVEASVYVEDEDHILEEDCITLKIKLIREHLSEKEEASYIHSLKYPHLHPERFYIILSDEQDVRLAKELNRVQKLIYVTSPKREIEEKVYLLAKQAGNYKLTVYVKPEGYLGLDQEIEVQYTVLPKNSIKREIFVHPEDAQLDNEPTLMQQLFQGLKKDDSDEEEEEEDEKDKNRQKRQQNRNDDEEEEEEKEKESIEEESNQNNNQEKQNTKQK